MPSRGNNLFSRNTLILLIAAVFLLSNLALAMSQENVWWDSAVYSGMGKYIFSDGQSGLWESSRPLVWPIILGAIWKLNLDIVFFGKIISLLFAAGTIVMTYLIAKEIFERKTAVLAAFLLAFTPSFFFFSKLMLTEISSTFFSLLGFYLLLRKSYLLSGLFFGLGFMTRFLQLIPFAIISLIFIFYNFKDRNMLKNMIIIGTGFIIPVVPYLILNFFLYGNVLQPFLDQIYLTNNSGWEHLKPWWFYPAYFMRENFLSIFALLGAYIIVRNKPNTEKTMIIAVSFAAFMLLSLIHHKEMRFIIMIMPFILMLASYGIFHVIRNIRKIRIPLSYILAIFILQSAIAIAYLEKAEIAKGNVHADFQQHLGGKDAGILWISNPNYALHYEGKVHNLMYYPIFDANKAEQLESNDADTILMDTCDLECRPNDIACQQEKEELISIIKENFRMDYNKKYGNCKKYIFAK